MGKATLTEEQRAEILARKAADPTITHAVLAADYDVNKSTITRVLANGADQDDAAGDIETSSPPFAIYQPHNRIHPSPLNPRKRFDPQALEDLSHSVEEKGVLQQLLVRYANQPGNTPIPDAQPADYEIIAGERRWRAAALVIDRGGFAGDHALPIRLVDPCDDLEHLKLALTENTARNDMTPMEEAEAFAKLTAAGASVAEIGKVAGRNIRTVQKRLRLVNDLTPKVREALADGDLTVEFANVLAAYCPKSKQDGTLQEITRGQWSTSSNLKSACLRLTRPTSVAFFDLAKYKGELIEDDDAPGVQYFADAEQFERLQQGAVDAKVEELLKTYKWAEVYDYKAGKYFYKSDFDVKKGDPAAGAIIQIEHNRSVHVHLNLVKRGSQVANSGSAQAERAPPEPVTKGHCIHAHQRKTLAMQEAIAAEPIIAMRLVCAALLGSGEAVRISADEIREGTMSEKVKSTITRFAAPKATLKGSKGLTFGQKGARVFEYDYYSQGQNDHAGLWAHLADMRPEDMMQLFAGLVALRCGSFEDYNPAPGDRAAAVAIADTLGLVGREAARGLTLQPEDLDGVRKDTLIACAKAAGIEGKMSDMKAKDLARYFRQMASPQYVFPTMKFGTMPEVKAQLAGMGDREADRARKAAAVAHSTLTDTQLFACVAVKKGPPSGLSGAEVIVTSGCTHEELVALVSTLVLKSDIDNFLTKGLNFPPDIVLTAFGAQRVMEPALSGKIPTPISFTSLGELVNQKLEKVAQETLEGDDWDADEKLIEIAQGLRGEDGTIIVQTDEEIRRAIIQGINACRLTPLDTPIAGDALFETDDAPVAASTLIDELFEIYAHADAYVPIEDIDDAVAFVCEKLQIIPTVASRSAAE